jgi:hypothetical protein
MTAWLYFCRPDNVAYHNLCIGVTLPKNIKSLLGLGLNFIPTPLMTSSFDKDVDIERFRKDIFTKCWFTGTRDRPLPPLFTRSNWQPPSQDIPHNLCQKINNFSQELNLIFSHHRCGSNLLPSQLRTLKQLKTDDNLIIFSSDKNLGPCIIDRSTYIFRAMFDHLLDTNTYRQLTLSDASGRITAVRHIIDNFLNKHFSQHHSDRKFIQRCLENVKDPFSYFYLLAKVHKTPWATRPIISVSGSLLQGLGKWVDHQLKIVCSQLPYIIRSSFDLSMTLRNMHIPLNAKLFSLDAVSMYTNIDTIHALKTITKYLQETTIHNINKPALIDALRIVMTHNVFKFGDTFWVQLSGTAMGAPPAPNYATLYYCIHEIVNIPQHPNLLYYGRYIDDGLGIWIPSINSISDDVDWKTFQDSVSFGKLKWEFTLRSKSLEFLDLTLKIQDNKIVTSLYEKKLNLYLYLPPHSCHPPGMIRGLVIGMIFRIKRLTSDETQIFPAIQQFYNRLLARGYSSYILIPIFQDAMKRNFSQQPKEESNIGDRCFLHLNYHQKNIPTAIIQQLYNQNIIEPPNDIPFSQISNHRGQFLDNKRLTIAHHRHPNIGNLLSPRRMESSQNPVSAWFI